MTKKIYLLSLLLICIVTFGAKAQTVVPAGTQVPLALNYSVSMNKKICKMSGVSVPKVGDPIYFHTTQDVYDDNDNLIIAENTPVLGEVSMVKKKGFWGSGSSIQISVKELKLKNGITIPLTNGIVSAAGEKNNARKILFWMFIWSFPLNYLYCQIGAKGQDANIEAGYIVNATVAQNVQF